MGTSTTILGFASVLAGQGHEVHILAPGKFNIDSPNIFVHGFGGDLAPLLYRRLRTLYNNPVIARRTTLSPLVMRSAATRIREAVERWLQKLHLDIVEGQQELASWACAVAARKSGLPSVAHFHNIWYEECTDLGLLNREDDGYRFLRAMTAQILEYSSHVITPTDFMLHYFLSNYDITSSKITHVRRGTKMRDLVEGKSSRPKRVSYAGTFDKNQGLELYFQTAGRSSTTAEFAACGKGDGERRLRDLAARVSPHLKFYWFQDKRDYYRFLASSSLGVIPWRKTLSRQLGFPMKLLDYMSVGLPSLCSRIGSWAEFIDSAGIGIAVSPHPNEWAEAITDLLPDEARLEEMRKRNLRLCEDTFSWRVVGENLLQVYDKLV